MPRFPILVQDVVTYYCFPCLDLTMFQAPARFAQS